MWSAVRYALIVTAVGGAIGFVASGNPICLGVSLLSGYLWVKRL